MSKPNGTYEPLTLDTLRKGLLALSGERSIERLARDIPQELKEFSEHLYYLKNEAIDNDSWKEL